MQARTAERAERAAKIISVASLLLLFLAVAMYAVIAFTGAAHESQNVHKRFFAIGCHN